MIVNIPKLRGSIVEHGFNGTSFAQRIGIDRSTFYRKIQAQGLTFTVGEVHKMIDVLHLTKDDIACIFLFDNSHKCEN